MDTQGELQKVFNSLPPIGGKKILLPDSAIELEAAVVLEYIRSHEYQRIKSEFERQLPLLNFDLWLWVSNLLAEAYATEPILFSNTTVPPPNYIDSALLEDQDVAKEEKQAVIDAYQQMRETWHDIEESGEQFSLRVNRDLEEVTLRRKGMGQFGVPFITSHKPDYEYLFNELRKDRISADVDPDIYLEYYYLRSARLEGSIYPPTLPKAYYNKLKAVGVRHQLFATPLDHSFSSYGSEYYDIDYYFGSFGSILKNRSAVEIFQAGGAFEVNIVQYGTLHTLVIGKLEWLIRHAVTSKQGITLFIVHDLTINKDENQDRKTYVRNIVFAKGRRNFLILKSKTAPDVPEQTINELFRTLDTHEKDQQELQGRYTLPILTPYEKAVVIGKRAEMLATGRVAPTIDVPKGVVDVLLVAELELEAKKCPMIITRPDGDWDVNELIDYDSGNYRYDKGPGMMTQ